MSWFEDYVPKYEPQYEISEPAPVLKYGLLEDLPNEEYEIEIDTDLEQVARLFGELNGSAPIVIDIAE